MTTKEIRKFTVQQIRDGKSHQEVLDELLVSSGKTEKAIHKIIRWVPSLEAREKYKTLNQILMGLLLLTAILKVSYGISVLQQAGAGFTPLILVLPVINFVLVWAVANYMPSAHLAVGLLSALGLLGAVQDIGADPLVWLDIVVLVTMVGLAFHLHKKLTKTGIRRV